MKKIKYVLIVIVLVTLTLRVYSQDDKDKQKYRLILSELSNSRCKDIVCDCRDDIYEIIRYKDSLERLRSLNPLPYPISVNVWRQKYEELCIECQRKHTTAKQNYFLSDPGVLKFIVDSIESILLNESSIDKAKNKCYWVENDYIYGRTCLKIGQKYDSARNMPKGKMIY